MKTILKHQSFIFLLFFILSVVIYWPLFFTFYQQDEWQGLGHMLALGFFEYIRSGMNLIQIIFGEGRILTATINYFLFLTFPFNVTLLSLYSIIFHTLNTFLLYLLTNKILKNSLAAFISSLFFLVNTIGHQAVSWFAASVSTLTATTLILISLIYLLNFFEFQKPKYIWISYIFLFISFYFKEIGLGLLLAYLFLGLIKKRRKIKKNELFYLGLPIFYFIAFAIYRTISIILSPVHIVGYISDSSPITSVLLSHFILYISSSIGQLFIPATSVFYLANLLISSGYLYLETTPLSSLIIQTLGTDIIMLILSSFILGFLYIKKRKEDTFAYFFSLIIILASILPYILIEKGNSYFESRYYYFPIVGASLLFGIFVNYIVVLKKRIILTTFTVLFILFSFWHIQYTYQDLSTQQQNARIRLSILNHVKAEIPMPSNKIIIYIASNQNYYISNNPLPFQQGVGYTFLVWLYNRKLMKISSLLTNNFLWNLGTEGYKQIGSEGYGYFYNLADLKQALKQYKFSPNDVYAFYWNGNNQQLKNTTKQIRVELK